MKFIDAIVVFFKILSSNEYVRRIAMAILVMLRRESKDVISFTFTKVIEAAGMPLSFQERYDFVYKAISDEYGHLDRSDINTFIETVWKTLLIENESKQGEQVLTKIAESPTPDPVPVLDLAQKDKES